MSATPVKHSTYRPLVYGSDIYYLQLTLMGGGAGNAPTVAANSPQPTNPACCAEVASITYVSTGVSTITLYDAYYAIAFAGVSLDDNSAAGVVAGPTGTLGTFTNLQTSTPLAFNLNTFIGEAAVDMGTTQQIRIFIAFKKNYTGAAA